MPLIRPCELPADALLQAYRRRGAWTDCFVTEVARPITHAAFVEAFYTTALFKVERHLLGWFAAKPSTDAEARALAHGVRNAFAAWRVEDRRADQLLLRDVLGRTRSWLMATPNGPGATRLYFGSAIAHGRLDFVFRALLGFHNVYSRALLKAASTRLMQENRRS